MRRWAMRVSLVLFVVATLVSSSFAMEMGIITGKEKGTYYQFGLNLRELVKPHNIQLNVFPSNGSIENIYAVYKRPGVPIGIVQSDVLAFVARLESNQLLKSVAKKIKMVFPLYNEEIHVLGRKDIVDFDDLANKRVAIGEDGSGTYLTARLLFEVSKVKPAEMVLVGTDEALARLKAGKIDAMFYVAGYPVRLFTEDVSEEDGLDLISITNKNILAFYPAVQIAAGAYKWQKRTVNTAAVKAVLISYDFDPRLNLCEGVGRLALIVSENLDWLVQNGHPKWKTVDLDYPLKGWEQYECVKRQIGKRKPAPNPAQINPVLDAIKQILEPN